MRVVLVMLIFLTAACNTPGADFQNSPVTRISFGKSTFDVRITENRAQAIRVNSEFAPRFSYVAPRGVKAIEMASGCRVWRLTGDASVMVAQLACGDGASDPHFGDYECRKDGVYYDYDHLVCKPAG